MLHIPPQDLNTFTVIGDTLLSLAGDSVIWTVQVSENLGEKISKFEIKIVDIPYDKNTDSTAYITEANREAEIWLHSLKGIGQLELMVINLPEIAPTTIAPGEAEIIMGIECVNLAIESDVFIILKSLKFDVEDKDTSLITPPSLVITGFRVLSEDLVLGRATDLSQNPIVIRQ